MSMGFLSRRLKQSEGALTASRGSAVARREALLTKKSWTHLLKFLGLAVQLGFLLLAIQEFQLVSINFYHYIMLFTFFGFLVNYFLPLKYRPPFFLAISLLAIVTIFGLPMASWLVGIGLTLIAICHLPIAYLGRVAVLLVAGAGLVYIRGDWLPVPWLRPIWPILGSMFMFRLIIYLYDVEHSKLKFNVSQSLGYFFMFPNLAFPLFPVIDYQTFRRTYYNSDQYEIYQKGITWMYRGLWQLVLFRLVNYYGMLAPEDVTSLADLGRYMLANYMLYLRVSGQFHLVVGILLLFGFNLPETHKKYFLASSFTDFWRRINIYWKDFMQKVFFMPVYFRLRKLGPTVSLVISTVVVFFVTWITHSYQWFWLKGTWLFSDSDMAFWAILAVMVIANSLYEAKYGRKRSLKKRRRGLRESLSLGLRTAGTFAFICILWSLWTSPSIADWFSLLALAGIGF